MAVRLYRDDSPRPMFEYEMSFRLDGLKIKFVAQRWRDEDAHRSALPCFPDPCRPGTSVGVRLTDMRTGEASDPTSVVVVPGGFPRAAGARLVVSPDRPCRIHLDLDADAAPVATFDLLFEVGGAGVRLVGLRWLDADAHLSPIPCIPDLCEPGTSIGVRLISLRTGATCDPLPPESISGEIDLRGLGLLPGPGIPRPSTSRTTGPP